jgi:hypothetical protein
VVPVRVKKRAKKISDSSNAIRTEQAVAWHPHFSPDNIAFGRL